MDYNLLDALDLLEREKGVPADTILDALANALVSAYKRTPGAAEEARVTIDPDTGEPRMLHAFLFTPREPREDLDARLAVITSFYGGGNYFSNGTQIFCEAGIAWLSPAVRGSSGFGKDFMALNDRDLGGDEIIDLFYGARFLEDKLGLEPRQIGVAGGSHGGYATMRALTFPPETNGRGEDYDFGFGMSHAGFSSIVSFYDATNIPDWIILEAGDPAAPAPPPSGEAATTGSASTSPPASTGCETPG